MNDYHRLSRTHAERRFLLLINPPKDLKMRETGKLQGKTEETATDGGGKQYTELQEINSIKKIQYESREEETKQGGEGVIVIIVISSLQLFGK